MPDSRMRNLLWSVLLIASGVVLLFYNAGLFAAFTPIPQYTLAGCCLAAGIAFFVGFARAQDEWWRLIPAWTFLALSLMAGLNGFAVVPQPISAALVFGGLALAFAHIYLRSRVANWWALIPGGFMLVLGIVIGLSSQITRVEVLAALLFVGLGIVFLLLYWAGDHRRQWWALIPGAVLVIFGLLVLTVGQEGDNPLLKWWPALLILIGLVVGWRSWRRPLPEKLTVNTAPRATRQTPQPQVDSPSTRGILGEYSRPAPGASVEIIEGPDD